MRALAALLLVAGCAPTLHSRCRRVAGADAIFAPGRVVLVGEVHGTREMPQLFTDLVCRAAQHDDVLVGFEYEPPIGEAIERYLVSRGDRVERARIVASHITHGDGSASAALVDAFEALRRIAQSTGRVQVFGFRTAVNDAAYAANIEAAHRAHPHAVLLAYMGNSHAALQRDPDDHSEPAGLLLKARSIDLRSVALDWTGGEAYILGPRGPGVYTDEPDHRAGRPLTVVPYGSPAYDFAISVGRIHASCPIVPLGL